MINMGNLDNVVSAKPQLKVLRFGLLTGAAFNPATA